MTDLTQNQWVIIHECVASFRLDVNDDPQEYAEAAAPALRAVLAKVRPRCGAAPGKPEGIFLDD